MTRFRRGLPAGDAGLVLPREHYERIYAEDLHRRRGLWRLWNKQPGKFLWYAAMAMARPPILDIGCGGGHLAAMYRDVGRPGDYVAGIDYSSHAITIAKRQAPRAHFAQGDASTHPELLARGHYRTAVLLEVLEHVYEDLELLQMIPEGRHVVASVPSFPTDGHCRWFANADQVRKRYLPVVKFHRIVVEAGLQSDNRWWIFQGVRI
jgi:SAM-dependent methyltransferase